VDDFTKTKIAFAIAFLAILFTASPLILARGEAGFDVLGLEVTLLRVYIAVAAALALAVYSYGIGFLFPNAPQIARRAGDFLYAIAFVAPPGVFLLLISVKASNLVGALLDRPEARALLTDLLSSIAAVAAGASSIGAARLFRRRSREAVEVQLEGEEATFFAAAKSLFSEGHYDSAVIEAFKSLEASVRKRLLELGKLQFGPRVEAAVTAALRQGLLPEDLAEKADYVRQQRNLAAHGVEPMTKEKARRVLAFVADIHRAWERSSAE
jgi:HEPN domain-containing protein